MLDSPTQNRLLLCLASPSLSYLHSAFIIVPSNSSSNPPTSISSTSRRRSRSFQHHGKRSSSSRPTLRSPTYREQLYLTCEYLHARFPPHSHPLRMPRVQCCLSADDPLQRFRDQRNQREETAGQHRGMQGQDSPAFPDPSLPPAMPKNPATTRRRQTRSHSPEAIRLSTKFREPPVFSRTNCHVLFDDWKLRIQDKLTHNGDHYPCEASKVTYIMARLGWEVSKHLTLKRRRKALQSEALLDSLSDLYEFSLSMIHVRDLQGRRCPRSYKKAF